MKKLMLVIPVMSGVLWGSAGIFVRTLSAFGFDNFTIITSRFLLAAVILFVGIMAVDRSMLKVRPKDIWIFAMSGIFGMLGLNLCYNQAINQISLSLAAVLLSMSPIFVMILAAVILREKVTMRKIACSALAIAGCVLVSGILESSSGIKVSAYGALAGIAAALFYAIYSIFSKVAMKQSYNVFTITFYSLIAGVILMLPFTDWRIIGEFVAVSPVKDSVFLVLNALCTSVLPYVLFTFALSYIDAGRVSILAAGGEPSAAMIFGLIFYDEVPSVLSLCGIAVTILALWLLCKPPKVRESGADKIAADPAGVSAVDFVGASASDSAVASASDPAKASVSDSETAEGGESCL